MSAHRCGLAQEQVQSTTRGRRYRPFALALCFAFPIVFMLVSSLKPDQQIFGDLTSIKAFLPVGNISLDNYAAVFDRVPARRFLVNSIGISAVTVVLGMLRQQPRPRSPCPACEVRGKRVVFAAIIATLIVPFETLALPLVWWVNQLPWLVMQDG